MNSSTTSKTNDTTATAYEKESPNNSGPTITPSNIKIKPSAAQTLKPTTNPEEIANFFANGTSSGTIMKNEQEENQDHRTWPVISLIATIIPIMVWGYCFIVSGGSASEGDRGAVWWLIFIYYMSIGAPLAGISIAFGIKGLETSSRQLSILSLSLKATMIVIVILLLIFYMH